MRRHDLFGNFSKKKITKEKKEYNYYIFTFRYQIYAPQTERALMKLGVYFLER